MPDLFIGELHGSDLRVGIGDVGEHEGKCNRIARGLFTVRPALSYRSDRRCWFRRKTGIVDKNTGNVYTDVWRLTK